MSWSASSTSPSTMRSAASNSTVSMESSSPLQTPSSATRSPSSDQPPGTRDERQLSISSSEQNKDKDKERMTVPSACVQCRSKHLKCDGLSPCTRCSSNGLECVFVRSRRGFKGPRKNGAQKAAGSAATCPLVNPNAPRGPHVPSGLATPPDQRLQTLPRPIDLPIFEVNQDLASKPLPSGLDLRERCIEAFFYHFHPAHPFVLPRAQFMALRKEKPLDHLLAAMRYVGSFYTSGAPTTALGLEAERSIYQADCPRDGYRVQAMLILAIGLDGYTYQEKALQILVDAQDLALELGMNKREFALLSNSGSDVLEESWRRTWWELYIVDGMIAGVHQKSSFRLKDMPADVLLPCEEREYASGFIPQGHSLEDFDDESFDGRDFSYSSFTYRIAALRNLGRVLASRQVTLPDAAAVLRIDAYLVNWRLHLPVTKKECISSDGQLDEMLFQAHMITEATTVLLHREHSELDSSIAKDVTSCAPHKQIVPGETYNIHAAKTVQAAQDISKLITIPVPLVRHTHFFTCVVTLGSIVHLSCWSALMSFIQDDDLKQQLRLNIGALKTLWQVWPSAGKAFGQVKGVAQEIFAAKKHAAEVGYWSNISSQDEVMRSMVEDQNIMDELQLLS
ncbi:Zn2 DNA-binding protein [Venustampulla echinocandica]|uniref:Zn2 DNA-binding protein n=1 Tax=Venustampulla echinocandica TaxID=2656787 RepID=A0A370TNW0_9HELO|nr:Zn2 DNA-binding protein [Venustampulla echinocandica]RDL37212.1 Zn2 DNA-binding protein [Venustampulla echinocandica]